MTRPVRAAGAGTDGTGRTVTWTVSEGSRGRRWREVVAADGQVGHALLLETGPDGRFSHLEFAAADELWTLHPERDGTLHGNAVTAADGGVRHIEGRPFPPDTLLIVEGSTISRAAIAWHAGSSTPVGVSEPRPAVVLRIDPLNLAEIETITLQHRSLTRWRIGDGPAFDVDDDGLPLLENGRTWPLERS
jgi:hypothetical protein